MRRWSVALVLVVGAVSSGAWAQAPAAPPAPPAPAGTETAEQLFNRGAQHAEQGNFGAACPLLAESHRLDPQAGTLLHLADCEEHTGALVQALAHWREALSKLGASEKFGAFAKQRAEALEARIPRLTVRLAPTAPPGTRVLRGGVELANAALGVPMAVNPGPVEVVVIAPGRQEHRETVTLAEGKSEAITVQPGPEVGPVAAPPMPVVVPPEEPSALRRHRGSFITIGVAAALAVAGGALGGRTWAHFSDLARTCPGPCADSDLASLHREQVATNVLFAAAGATALVAVGLFVFGERRQPQRVTVAVDGPGARLMVRY